MLTVNTQKFIYLIIIISIIICILLFWIKNPPFKLKESDNQGSEREIRYVAIGDSYTIGLGIDEKNNWPNLLVKHLKKEGINVRLVANPAVSGFTVRDAIEHELPIVEKLRPDFITVLIGANDNFMETNREDYRRELGELLDKLQSSLKESKNIILVTIPDYSKSPTIQGSERIDMIDFIASYNSIIMEEGKRRGLEVADIFPISQTMTESVDYISDGLHPSPGGYSKWEKIIFPVVYDFLANL